MKKIGIVGLGLRNPYTYAPILEKMGATVAWVWDVYPEVAQEFAAEFGCKAVGNMENFPINEADGVIIESTNNCHLDLARPFIKKKIPTFIEKPMSNDPSQVISFFEEFPDAPFFSASPLRFSPVYLEMQKNIEGPIHLCKVSVFHTMEHFLTDPKKIWHDKVALGGGMLIDIGIHAIELLNMFMKTDHTDICYIKSTSHFKDSESGDNHTISIKYTDGSIAQLTLLCATNVLDYAVEVYSTSTWYENSRSVRYLGNEYSPENAYGGFVGTMQQFVTMINTGVRPIEPAETIRNFKVIQGILDSNI